MKVLITGISGFVGGHLARRLLADGAEVAGLRLGGEPAIPGTTLVTADLRDADQVTRAVRKVDPDVIFHLGGLSHVGQSWGAPADYFQVNVLGSENVLQAADGRRVVVASSAEVYGAVPESEQPIPEHRPLRPCSPYALTKAAMERLALAKKATVVRAFNCIGPGQSSAFALPTFAGQLAAIASGEQEPVLRVGNLAAERDFLHVCDAVRGYHQVAERGEAGTVYNLGSGHATSIRCALEALIDLSGLEVRVEVDRDRFRPVDVPTLQADTSRIRSLGWEPRRSMRDALEELWQDVQGR